MSNKKIEEVFSDYITSNNIKYARIENLSIIKKTNTLQISIYYDEWIEIKEIWLFEKFLKERFHFENIDTKIRYHEAVKLNFIKDEWKNIIAYMAHKYPLMKPMLLLKSDIEVNKNEIKIKMHIKGADFLKARKTDKELEKVLENLFNKKYKIDIVEELSKEEIDKIKQDIEETQNIAISHIEEENREAVNTDSKGEIYEEDPNYVPPQDIEGYIPEEDMQKYEINDSKIEEYIIGKKTRAKENLIKIKDITSEGGKVTIEGRIVSNILRETKSGKGMIILEIYDGTGLIRCKIICKRHGRGKRHKGKDRKCKNYKNYRKSRTRYLCRRCNNYCKYCN